MITWCLHRSTVLRLLSPERKGARGRRRAALDNRAGWRDLGLGEAGELEALVPALRPRDPWVLLSLGSEPSEARMLFPSFALALNIINVKTSKVYVLEES